MKLTKENFNKVFDYIESQIEDENGRGEFDEETSILSAVERTIEMLNERLDGMAFKNGTLINNKAVNNLSNKQIDEVLNILSKI